MMINRFYHNVRLLLILTLIGCLKPQGQKLNTVTKSQWIYRNGYYIGDVVFFSDSIRLFDLDCDGNVYKNGNYVATITQRKRRSLRIESIDKKVGVYYIFGAEKDFKDMSKVCK